MTKNQKEMKDTPIYLSIILTTNRNKEALEPLFVNSDKNAELIISDNNYNGGTKKYLKTQIGKYEKIVYAPIKESRYSYQRNFAQGLNTSLLLSENGWIVRVDDSLEFKSDFFQIIRDDIKSFIDVVGNERFALIGQKLWNSLGHQKWNDYYSVSNPSRFIPVDNPSFTFSFGVYPVDLIYNLNGYDERYDIGFGFEDTQFLHRSIVAGYKIFYDRQMMGFSHKTQPQSHGILPTKMMYEFEVPELNSGKIQAFNPFNFVQLQRGLLAKREDYVV